MKLIAFSLMLAAVTGACRSAGEAPKAVEVTTVDAQLVQARTQTIVPTFEAGGVVKATLTAPITSRVMAPVAQVLVRPGDRVRAGQALVLLDGRDLDAHAIGAAAAVTAAEQAVRAAQADRQAAVAAHTLATAGHGRLASLYAAKAATAQELDEAVARLRGAEANAEAAQARVAQSEGALAAAKAAAAAATVTAAYATIAAPFAGTITTRSIDPGVLAAPGTPLLTLEDTSAARLELRVDADRAAAVAAGQAVSVRCNDRSATSWTDARVSEVSRIDPNGHSFLVKVDCPDATPSGTFGRARFPLGQVQALTVPASALVQRGQLTVVFAIDSAGAARLRPVTAGTIANGQVGISAGLLDGEQVVDHPSPSLVDGTPITSAAARQAAHQTSTGAAR